MDHTDRSADAERMGAVIRCLTLTERERKLIALLAEGLTDESAARRMQLSSRTVTNILRSLMNRLGVDNRFQLGLAIGMHSQARGSGSPDQYQFWDVDPVNGPDRRMEIAVPATTWPTLPSRTGYLRE
jgi:DNA-binding CsgD family transcriptional regulator